MQKMIRSPLNYTGNKSHLLPQIQPYFPDNIDTMVDLFCGGATVGLNTNCKKVIFIDNDPNVIGLLKFLATSNYDKLFSELCTLIEKFGLSCSIVNGYRFYREQIKNDNPNNGLKQYNSTGYYNLREAYNSLSNKRTNYAYKLLYLLILYGFNNDIRFSKDGRFNLPVGKTDLNKRNAKKLEDFIKRVQEINCEFICGDFKTQKIQTIIKSADFVYMDPPYLITNAVYNESGRWCEQNEYEIIRLMNFFIETQKPFVLSNVLEKQGRRNEPLYYWTSTVCNRIKIVDMEHHYRNASYNKKNRGANEREVIITLGESTNVENQ